MLNHENQIKVCLRAVEKQFDNGSNQQWSTQDFGQLAEAIHAKTGTLLSISTLKRIWGRVKHNTKPNRSTLDALAQYVDYDNWMVFVKAQEKSCSPEVIDDKVDVPYLGRSILVVAGLGLIIAILALTFRVHQEKEWHPYSRDFNFSGKVVSDGLPNSVVFTFNPVDVGDRTKIEIQQSWDKRKRTTVDNSDSVATSIYMRPGHFKAKFVVNDSIVAEDNVYIPTNDWLGLIELNPKPIYLKKEEVYNGNELSIAPEVLKNYGINPAIDETWVGFYNIRDFGELYTDDFTLETAVKNTWNSGVSKCQNVRIAILYDGGAVVIPLSVKGCSSNLRVIAFDDQIIDGKKNDLSGFGVGFDQFERVKCISGDGKLEFYVNNDIILSVGTEKPHKKIVGIVYNFQGTGIIKELSLSNGTGTLYKLEQT